MPRLCFNGPLKSGGKGLVVGMRKAIKLNREQISSLLTGDP